MNYRKEIKEFAKVRMEQTPNNTQIARDIINKFNINKEVEIVRKTISRWRLKEKINAKKLPIKRLFFDIETSFYELNIKTFSLRVRSKYFNHEDIIKEQQIICISYKWQYEDKVYTLDWRMGEKKMIKTFIENVMDKADEIIGHNVDRFDVSVLRTRALYHGILMFPRYRTLDTLKKSKNSFRFASNKLDYIGKFCGIGGKLENEGFELWERVVNGDDNSLNKMIQYCERDVILLEDIFFVLSPFITHNTNFAVLKGGSKWECPECTSKNVEMYRTYTTPMGVVRRNMKCNDCKKQYLISNKTYMKMLENSINAG
jgi:predicted PolB exonuclease-like 3'-5' exonuclease